MRARWSSFISGLISHIEGLARIFHELLSRDHKDGRATGQPQGVGSEAYLNGTSQGPTSEDARKDGHIRGRSKGFMKYPGYICFAFPASLKLTPQRKAEVLDHLQPAILLQTSPHHQRLHREFLLGCPRGLWKVADTVFRGRTFPLPG